LLSGFCPQYFRGNISVMAQIKSLKNPAAVALGRLGGLKGRPAILLVRQTAQP
jgi:hypothetical protein